MIDRPHAPPCRHAAVLRAALRVTPANSDVPYVDRLNGTPPGSPPRSQWYPLPVLDLDVGRDDAWRRLRFEVAR